MDKASAQNVIRTSIRVMALFDQLLADLKSSLPEPAFAAERQRIGLIMAGAADLIRSAGDTHPSLNIEGDEAWRRAGELDAPRWLRMVHHS